MGTRRLRVRLPHLPKTTRVQLIGGGSGSEDATLELRVKTVKYFKSIEKVQDEVEAKYGSVGSIRLGLGRASAA